jgi:TonB family protein
LGQTFVIGINSQQNNHKRHNDPPNATRRIVSGLLFLCSCATGIGYWQCANSVRIDCTVTSSTPGGTARGGPRSAVIKGRPRLRLQLPAQIAVNRPARPAPDQADLVDSAVTSDEQHFPSLAEQPKLRRPMAPLDPAQRPTRSVTGTSMMNDTAVERASVAMPVKSVDAIVPKLRETNVFGESSCEQPRNCPYRRTWDNWYCASANSGVRFSTLPTPHYPEAAQKLHIQGEIKLVAVFGGDGQIHVKKLLNSLGYALDESAAAAVVRIGFQPALQGGCAVDSERTIRVTFGDS